MARVFIPLFLIILRSFSCHSGNLYYLDLLESNQQTSLVGDTLCRQHNLGELTRLDGVQVGYKRVVDLGKDGERTMITRAMRPLLFEVPNFLTSEECDYFIQRAKETGLFTSTTNSFPKRTTEKFDFTVEGRAGGFRGEWETWDRNGDNIVSLDEVKKYAEDYRHVYFADQELMLMFRNLSLHEMDDGWITRYEFELMNTLLLDNYLMHLRKTHPKHKARFSEQAFVEHRDPSDKIFSRIMERLSKLTKLPRTLVEESEQLQVVRYTIDGHYNAHYDSEYNEPADLPCCQQVEPHIFEESFEEPVCKLCRYLTVGYYLNDVPSGGETAFPIADNGTYLREAMYGPGFNRYELVSFCNKANLIVKPEKGKAVIWYNHFMDENGWLGVRDEFSLHGGCGVREGEKWFANNWIYAPYDKFKDLPNIWTFQANE